MQFGVQFFPSVSPDEKSAAAYFAESLAIAEEAESLGFTHARTVEHYFERYGGYSPNPIVFLSALSQRTRSMRLVTGAVLPIFNHPLKLAGEIGMLDGISGGRLEVGFARAFLPHEFAQFGVSLDESRRRFSEGLSQIIMLLKDAREHYDFVVLDTPPILPVFDAAILQRLVDGVLVVVSANQTPRKLLAEALNLLRLDTLAADPWDGLVSSGLQITTKMRRDVGMKS